MKAYDTYAALDGKLGKLLADELLVHKFDRSRYPLVLTITPDKDPEAQMAMFASDEGASSADASLVFLITADSLRMKINGRFYIEDALLNKIKGLAKKLATAYLFGFFADQFTKNGDDIGYTGNPDDDAAEENADHDADTDGDADGEAFDGFFDDDAAEDDQYENDSQE